MDRRKTVKSISKKTKAKKIKTKEAETEDEIIEFKKWFDNQNSISKSGLLYEHRADQIEERIKFINQNIQALQFEKQILQGNTQFMDEMNEVLRKVGEKNMKYDIHFVDPHEVKKGIERFKDDRFEAKDRFSEIQDKIDELRELKENMKKRKEAVKSVLDSLNLI